jgi:hypothetical protein
MLLGVLFVLGYTNDYVKKLIGKYIILELRSLYECLKKLCKFDQKYGFSLFCKLKCKIDKLERQEFKKIRNKLIAHRDTHLDIVKTTELWKQITRRNIYTLISIFKNHLDELLKDYPVEADLYFAIREEPFKGITKIDKQADYEPFDKPFKL